MILVIQGKGGRGWGVAGFDKNVMLQEFTHFTTFGWDLRKLLHDFRAVGLNYENITLVRHILVGIY